MNLITRIVGIFRPSVASEVAAIEARGQRLERIRARETERSAKLQIKASLASQEAFRAGRIAERIKAFTA